MGYWNGVADAMLEGRAAGAESAAASASADAFHARRMQAIAESALERERSLNAHNASVASGALATLHALADVLEQMPEPQRKFFLRKLGEANALRMAEADKLRKSEGAGPALMPSLLFCDGRLSKRMPGVFPA